MSGSQTIAAVLGASTTIGAITSLPNTGTDAMSFVLPVLTLVVVSVAICTRLYKIAILSK